MAKHDYYDIPKAKPIGKGGKSAIQPTQELFQGTKKKSDQKG